MTEDKRPTLPRATCALILAIWGGGAFAESYLSMQERRPELFHPDTGYRIDQQRAPTPEDIPAPAQWVAPEQARQLIANGAVVLDVSGALQSRYDELDGTWLVPEQKMSLPGAVWLPEVGRGVLDETMKSYLQTEMGRVTGGDLTHPIVVYCVADCWMSWNAAQRITGLGYAQVYWFQLGTDGWREQGWPLSPVDPIPVNVD